MLGVKKTRRRLRVHKEQGPTTYALVPSPLQGHLTAVVTVDVPDAPGEDIYVINHFEDFLLT